MPPNGNINAHEYNEDLTGRDDSVRHQWNVLQMQLHLPDFNTLNTHDEERVVLHIAEAIGHVRHTMTRNDVVALSTEMTCDFTRDVAAFHSAQTTMTQNERIDYARASAGLKALYRHLTDADVRGMIQELSQVRTSVANHAHWLSIADVTIGANTGAIQIDFQHPVWRSGTRAEIRARLQNREPHQVGILLIDRISGAPMAIPRAQLTPGEIDAIFLSQCEARDPNSSVNAPPIYTVMTLDNALAATEPIARLAAGTGDNRELLLALSAIQRNPMAAQVLGGGNRSVELTAARTRLEQEKSLSVALAKMEGLKIPSHTRAHLDREITDLRAASHVHGTRNSGFYNFNAKEIEKNEHHLENLDNLVDTVNQVRAFVVGNTTLRPLLENAPTGAANNLDYLRTFLLPVAPPPGLPAGPNEPAIVANRLNPTTLVQTVRAAFNRTPGTDKSASLASVTQYDKLLEDNFKQLEEAQKLTTDTGANACWAVIRRSLEDEGLRGKELDKTIEYMRAQSQRSPESVREAADLAQSAFSYEGENNRAARKEWNTDKDFTRVADVLEWGGIGGAGILGGAALTGPFGWAALGAGTVLGIGTVALLKRFGFFDNGYNALHVYQRNLFNPQNIGMRLTDDPLNRSLPLSRVIDAYFKTKYLFNLPKTDPKHLPDSVEITEFLRRTHRAIIERGQESFGASGAGTRDREAVRAAAADVTEDQLTAMSISARQTALQNILADDAYYTDAKIEEINRMTDKAYKPIQDRLDKHVASIERWKRLAGVAGGAVKNVAGAGLNYGVVAPAKFTKDVTVASAKFGANVAAAPFILAKDIAVAPFSLGAAALTGVATGTRKRLRNVYDFMTEDVQFGKI